MEQMCLVNIYQRHGIYLKSTFQIIPSSCYTAPASVGKSVEYNSPWDIKNSNQPSVCPLKCTIKDACVTRIFERMQKSAYYFSETAKDLGDQLLNGTFN